MNIRRFLTSLTPVMLGAMLVAGSASATPIIVTGGGSGTYTVYGNIPSFTIGSGGTTSAAKFDTAAANAYMTSNCAPGYTCSGLTLIGINFSLTSTTDITLVAGNTSGSTKYIAPIAGFTGTFAGGATSGVAIDSGALVSASDSITTGLVVANPTLTVATDTRRTRSSCGTGTVNSTNFQNCLAIANGGRTFTGTDTDTQGGGYSNVDTNWASVLSLYVGSGSVTFNLTSSKSSSNGTLFGVDSISNNGTEQAVTNGLQVDYQFTYDETLTPTAPEPGTITMMGGALLLAGVLRKKLAGK